MHIRQCIYGTVHKKEESLFDMELILNNQVKYLGVILDSKLNWKFHIDKRIRWASVPYWQCRGMQ
jgi:hypothetical protein